MLPLLLCAGALGLGARAAAQPPAGGAAVATETRLQAAYLLKFPAYVEWPDGRTPPAPGASVIGVANAEDVAAELQRIAERLPAPARPTIRIVRGPEALAGVHVLYLGGDDWPRYQRWVQQASAHGVLLVSANPGALDYGSMINFRLVDDRVRFEVSLAAADKGRLKIGAPLLALALAVVRAP